MNLSLLKSAAELAKTSPLELEIWQMEISPDDVLRLVEVARLARELAAWSPMSTLGELMAEDLRNALEGVES